MAANGVGKQVRERRETLLMTQDELARKAGVSTATVTRLERSASLPKAATLRRIARALELPEEAWLAELEDDDPRWPRKEFQFRIEQATALAADIARGQADIHLALASIVEQLERIEARLEQPPSRRTRRTPA